MARFDKSYQFHESEVVDKDGDSQLLSAGTYKIREAGIEFRSEKEVGLYTEMRLQVMNPETQKVVKFNGVVVGCSGDRHQGFQVSLVFTNITKDAQISLYEMYWAQM